MSSEGRGRTSTALFGFEAFFRTLELRSRGDALVAAIHWILVTDGLRSVGVNDEDDGQGSRAAVRHDDAELSELLPAQWNNHTGDFYALSYVRLKKKPDDASILVKMIFADGILIVSILRPTDNKTASISLPLADYILEDFQNYTRAYRNLDDLQVRVETELLGPLNLIDIGEGAGRNPDGSPGSREGRSTRRDDYSTYEERTNPPGGPYHRPDPLGSSFSDDDVPLAPPIGRGDLDPFGRGQGGGMFMDPRHFPRVPLRPVPGGIGPEILPRGAVPPGARFDPFGPPIPDRDRRRDPRFGGPDPDHLPPPGYDDMFG